MCPPVALQPSSSSQIVLGSTMSACIRPVLFRKMSNVVKRSVCATAAFARSLSAKEDSIFDPKVSMTLIRRSSIAASIASISSGTQGPSPVRGGTTEFSLRP